MKKRLKCWENAQDEGVGEEGIKQSVYGRRAPGTLQLAQPFGLHCIALEELLFTEGACSAHLIAAESRLQILTCISGGIQNQCDTPHLDKGFSHLLAEVRHALCNMPCTLFNSWPNLGYIGYVPLTTLTAPTSLLSQV